MNPDYSIGIKHIADVTCCPKCGNEKVKERRTWAQHCSGHWNESVEFDCGAKYEFTPNYMCVGLASICKDNPDFKARRELVDAVKAELMAHAQSRGLCEEDMKQLKDKLEYFRVSTW